MSNKILTTICVVSALALALSFAAPVTKHLTYVDANGEPLGLLGQMFPDRDANRVVSYGFFWEDLHWSVPLVFFVPALLAAFIVFGKGRLRRLLIVATPFIATWLIVLLVAMVSLADFHIFPGMGGERVFGGYLAVCALACFLVAAGVLGAVTARELVREKRIR